MCHSKTAVLIVQLDVICINRFSLANYSPLLPSSSSFLLSSVFSFELSRICVCNPLCLLGLSSMELMALRKPIEGHKTGTSGLMKTSFSKRRMDHCFGGLNSHKSQHIRFHSPCICNVWSCTKILLCKGNIDLLCYVSFCRVFRQKSQVQELYEDSTEYEGKHEPKKLEELGNVLTSLDPGDSIVIAKAFSHML